VIIMNSTDIRLAQTPQELGDIARASREKTGISLRKAASEHSFGTRFLSEFERGKATAELGKVMEALHATGLDLAVVPRHKPPATATALLSQQLNLEFPYDWSNPDMDESTLILLVLDKARFNDILSITYYFGIARISTESKKLTDAAKVELVNKYLRRIEKGITLSRK